MSKLDVAAIFVNLTTIIVSVHVALSEWVDRTTIPFFYFYIICVGMILNAAYTFFKPNSSN